MGFFMNPLRMTQLCHVTLEHYSLILLKEKSHRSCYFSLFLYRETSFLINGKRSLPFSFSLSCMAFFFSNDKRNCFFWFDFYLLIFLYIKKVSSMWWVLWWSIYHSAFLFYTMITETTPLNTSSLASEIIEEHETTTHHHYTSPPSLITENSDDPKHLRMRIQEILEDKAIPASQKPHRIQALMSQRKTIMETAVAAEEEKEEEEEETGSFNELLSEITTIKEYNGDDLGCKHYKCGVKVKAPCCRKWYVCRLCHDEVESHTMDRYAITQIICMHCSHMQSATQICVQCNTKLAHYYCDMCKLWDNDPSKDIYHCNDCKLCRRGKGLDIDYYHCKTCQTCISTTMKDNHRCIERLLDCNCPICGEYLFTSRDSVGFMACGHPIHLQCIIQHASKSYRCPICFQTIADTTLLFQRMDEALKQQPMPPEFAGFTAQVLCNDCHKESRVPYHFLYHKCLNCRSFNTRVLNTMSPQNSSVHTHDTLEDVPLDEDY
jgi:RING finger/CHY zinc finger protein 1